MDKTLCQRDPISFFTLDNYGGTFPAQPREAAERFAALVGSQPRT